MPSDPLYYIPLKGCNTESAGQKWPWKGSSAWMVGRCVTGSILCSQDFPLPFHLWICPQTQYFLKEAEYYVSLMSYFTPMTLLMGRSYTDTQTPTARTSSAGPTNTSKPSSKFLLKEACRWGRPEWNQILWPCDMFYQTLSKSGHLHNIPSWLPCST